MPTMKDTDTRARVLHWRLRGLDAAAAGGEDNWLAPKIAERLGITKQTVYYHLHRLEADGEIVGAVKVYRKQDR